MNNFESPTLHTASELVMAHLKIDKATFNAIPKNGAVVTPLP